MVQKHREFWTLIISTIVLAFALARVNFFLVYNDLTFDHLLRSDSGELSL